MHVDKEQNSINVKDKEAQWKRRREVKGEDHSL